MHGKGGAKGDHVANKKWKVNVIGAYDYGNANAKQRKIQIFF